VATGSAIIPPGIVAAFCHFLVLIKAKYANSLRQ
jgi:hypothetical protein